MDAKYEWFIRFDSAFNENLSIVSYIKNKCVSYIIYEHPEKSTGKSVHCHAYIKTNITDDTIRDQIKKSVNIKGYCKKPNKDLLHLIAYMSKGKYEPKLVSNIEQHVIDNGTLIGYDKDDVKQKLEAYKETRKTEAKRITNFDIEFQIEEEYKNSGYSIERIEHFKLFEIVKKVHKEHKKGSFDLYVMRTMQSVEASMNPDNQWERLRKFF